MTTTTSNEAAERQEPIACQRCGQGVLPEDQPAHDEWDEALAAERLLERVKTATGIGGGPGGIHMSRYWFPILVYMLVSVVAVVAIVVKM